MHHHLHVALLFVLFTLVEIGIALPCHECTRCAEIRFILSNCPVVVDEVAAFPLPCCVHGDHVYQHMYTPFLGEITTTVRDLDNTSDHYAAYQCDYRQGPG